MQKKSEFIFRVKNLANAERNTSAASACSLALQIDEDTLPDDMDAAARRLVDLVKKLKREIPAA